jgi:hypothetical protein
MNKETTTTYTHKPHGNNNTAKGALGGAVAGSIVPGFGTG